MIDRGEHTGDLAEFCPFCFAGEPPMLDQCVEQVGFAHRKELIALARDAISRDIGHCAAW